MLCFLNRILLNFIEFVAVLFLENLCVITRKARAAFIFISLKAKSNVRDDCLYVRLSLFERLSRFEEDPKAKMTRQTERRDFVSNYSSLIMQADQNFLLFPNFFYETPILLYFVCG